MALRCQSLEGRHRHCHPPPWELPLPFVAHHLSHSQLKEFRGDLLLLDFQRLRLSFCLSDRLLCLNLNPCQVVLGFLGQLLSCR